MKVPTFIVKKLGRKSTVQMLLVGLCLGLTLGIAFVPYTFDSCSSSSENPFISLVNPDQHQQEEQRNYYFRQVSSNKNSSIFAEEKRRIKRPRYFSTELGLRRKLFVGIILSDSQQLHIENLIAINQTLSPKVDKFLFFIGGSQSSNILTQLKIIGLSNVVQVPVGTESNVGNKGEKESQNDDNNKFTTVSPLTTNNIDYDLVALKVLKYFGDKFVDKFDYFALFLDNYYINGRFLVESLSQISVGQDIFWGSPAGNSCALEPGFVISRKIVQKLSFKIERCLPYSNLKLSKCLNLLLGNGKYSCDKLTQNILYSSVPVHSTLEQLKFAITVGPVKDPTQIYRVHGKISLSRSADIQHTIHKLQDKIQSIIPSLPSKYQTSTWPLGISRGTVPKSRFEVIKWIYFDTHQMYSKTEVSSANNIEGIDREDLNHVINSAISLLNNSAYWYDGSVNNKNNLRFHHGYRRLNPSRGMEYLLDFKSNDSINIIRVNGIRPICKSELLSMPYVTENRRVTIIVPVTIKQNIAQVRQFLDRFFDFSVDQKLNTVLILALIFKKKKGNQFSFQSKTLLTSDSLKLEQIQEVKSLISYYNGKAAKNMMTDSAKVGYILIPSYTNSNGYITTVDAVIKRIVGQKALILVADVKVVIKDEFINRVRMNTILKWQAFSPIPFLEYNPSVYQPLNNKKTLLKEDNVELLEVSKNSGYFDTSIHRYFSFFAADYLAARKSANSSFLFELEHLQDFSSLELLFLRVSTLHILRAPEPNLKVSFSFPSGCSTFKDCVQSNWGSRSLLAKTIFGSLHI